MKRDRSGIEFSPSDLAVFLGSEFASWMDRWEAERCAAPLPPGADWQPDPEGDDAAILKRKGLEHERACLQRLQRDGHPVAHIDPGPAAEERTRQAMRDGVPVLYQAALRLDRYRGRPDFLWRRARDEDRAPWIYEPLDAKLARSPRPEFILQLCAYAEMLEHAQGARPESIEIWLGSGERRCFDTEKFFYYYRALRRAFEDFQSGFDATHRPHPDRLDACGRWTGCAEQALAASDDLRCVARLTGLQAKRLQRAGIDSMAALAASSSKPVPRLQPDVLARLRQQARLQIASRGAARPAFEPLCVQDANARRGLALLPPVSPLDVFFDMEGDPLAEGGLEYLWGAAYVQAPNDAPIRLGFRDWWALEAEDERAAFEGFVDWAYERWQRDRSMHIYHYAPYEVNALRRLMGKHASREREVDDLLRHEVLVDLYTVVRQGVAIGTADYSLKDIEPLYAPQRQGSVKTASRCLAAFQEWLETRAPEDVAGWQASPLLRDIRDYNRVDCESLHGLVTWMRQLQRDWNVTWMPRTEPQEEKEDPRQDDPARALALRMLSDAEAQADPEARRLQEMLAHLLEFHWREMKPVWWRMFDRHERSEDELWDDLDCLAGLERTGTPPRPSARSMVYEYRYDPEQDTKLEAGDPCLLAHDLGVHVRIESLDRDAGRAGIKWSARSGASLPQRLSLIPDAGVRTDVLAHAVLRYVESWARGEVRAPAVDDFLRRRAPRIEGHAGGPILPGRAEPLVELADVVRRLRCSTLCIQGPPGTGKTYTAARLILDLVRDGRRVGVMANSHKAILNLMQAVHREASKDNCRVHLVKVGEDVERREESIQNGDIELVTDRKRIPALLETGPVVVGGTAWVFCREELEQRFDHLFVDEAGQVSVANIVAAGLGARSIVLVGDQMQLAQPIQGSHPGESGQSALDYLLQDKATIPPDFGVFLDVTWRMHPSICSFVSQTVYERRLNAHPVTARQRVGLAAGERTPRRGLLRLETGLAYVPVTHEGNAQASDEEVEVIAALVDELCGRTYHDREGGSRALRVEDILVVAPYNMQVRRLERRLPAGARVGSVDRFQGQEAPVVIVSMCASSLDECPRGIDFLLSPNRLNVAISRAQCLAVLVGSPGLLSFRCRTLEQMQLLNLYCRLTQEAEQVAIAPGGSAVPP